MKVIFAITAYTGGKCMLVEQYVLGKASDVIAPHGCCSGYEANYGKLHDTRNPSAPQT